MVAWIRRKGVVHSWYWSNEARWYPANIVQKTIKYQLIVYDAGPTFNQQWVNVLCLKGE